MFRGYFCNLIIWFTVLITVSMPPTFLAVDTAPRPVYGGLASYISLSDPIHPVDISSS